MSWHTGKEILLVRCLFSERMKLIAIDSIDLIAGFIKRNLLLLTMINLLASFKLLVPQAYSRKILIASLVLSTFYQVETN